ncbi:MAG: DUF7586 domain-containing protein [Intrasporangium sp.]|uniref:DUF7586 domain-containing protein n=1 Tax=Intrasporangium sp. TaxID=1925024 RepID=UPI003F7DE9C4
MDRWLRTRLRHGSTRRAGLRRARRRNAGLPHRPAGPPQGRRRRRRLRQQHVGGGAASLATDLLETVLDHEPSLPSTWRPESPRPELAPLLGLWWSEGSPITFFVRDGQLWSRLSERDPLSETRYAADGPDRFRAVEGRERGEVLEVVRDDSGEVERLYFATYAVTRQPLAFADLQD